MDKMAAYLERAKALLGEVRSYLATVPDRSRAWWGEACANPLFWRANLGALIIIGLDQLSKYWIVHKVKLPEIGQIEVSSIFNLTYVQNYGASFGMLEGMRWPLAFLSLSIALGLTYWLGTLKRAVPAIGIAFVVGGALGNLYDRIAYGYVVDFLDFSAVPFINIERVADFPYFTVFIGGFIWVFNVADMAINVGIAFILLDAFLTREPKSKA